MNKHYYFNLLGIFLVLGVASGGHTQMLEEIIVTAQKREQNLQETPVAVTAFTGDYLEKFQINEIDDITTRAPGVSLLRFNRSETVITMRGAFSSNSDPLADNTFAIFIDDIYFGRRHEHTLDLVDLERIEVLRGPQGTLFGRNVVGGALNVVTATPDEHARGMIDLSYGEYDGTGNDIITVRAKASGALSDKLFASATVKYEDEGGWSENVQLDNAEMGGGEIAHVRGKLRWVPTDKLDIVFGAHYIDDDGQGTPWFLVAGDPDLDPTVVRNTFAATNGDFDDTDVAQLDTAGKNKKELYGGNLHINWDLDLFGESTLTSITSWRKSKADFLNDDLPSTSTGTNFLFSANGSDEQVTQEVRLAGQTGQLNWLVGIFYLYTDADYETLFDVDFGLSGSFLNFALANGFLGNPPPFPPFPLGFDGFFKIHDNQYQEGQVKSFAVFTHNTYSFNDWLNFTAGLRWTRDKKEGSAWGIGTPRPSGVFLREDHEVSVSDSWEALTPKFILDATFDDIGLLDNIFVYGSVARGFKSGGFLSDATAEASSTPIDPEFVWNYEAGVKTTLFNERARFNLTYYRADYTDLQTTLIPTGSRSYTIVNAGEAAVDGIELEAMALITDGLLFNISYAWTDARFTSFEIPPNINFTGNNVAQTPEHSWSADLSYTTPLGPGEAQVSLHYAFRGDSFFDADNATQEAIVDYVDFREFNATASYDWNDWRLSIWGKNLTDERALYNGLPLFGQFSQSSPLEFFSGEPFITGVVSPGRSYGISIRKTWGEDK